MSDEKPASVTLALDARLEALLFVAPGPVSVGQLATALEVTPHQAQKGLTALEESYATRGIRLQRHNKGIQLTSAPESAGVVEKFLNLEATTRLSQAALETLAIIAYQQPVTRPQIDSIRGVNSDGVLRNLLSKGLVDEAGRAEGPGRPILYTITPDFLQHFGLANLQELPPLSLEDSLSEPENGEEENPLLKE